MEKDRDALKFKYKKETHLLFLICVCKKKLIHPTPRVTYHVGAD
jgi:hypothetical protein